MSLKSAAGFLAGLAIGVLLTVRQRASKRDRRRKPRRRTVAVSGRPAAAAGAGGGGQSKFTVEDVHARIGGAIVIGVGGASGSGKSTLAVRLKALLERHHFPPGSVAMLQFDSYYKGLSGRRAAEVNFDDPVSVDTHMLATHLRQLKAGRAVEVPKYDFTTHTRLSSTEHVESPACVILDGIFTLTVPEIRHECDITVYVLEDLDTCLVRRLRRDLLERGRDTESVLDQYSTFVKPGFHDHIEPNIRSADLIVPAARDNKRAQAAIVAMVVQMLHSAADEADDE